MFDNAVGHSDNFVGSLGLAMFTGVGAGEATQDDVDWSGALLERPTAQALESGCSRPARER